MNTEQLGSFKAKYAERGSDECWNWTAANDGHGYGVFKLNNRNIKAHRIACVIATGEQIPESMCVLHACDNRSCVNPRHLSVGDKKKNAREMVERGRWNGARGDRHHMRLHPENLRRGDKHHSRLNPECMARGERNGSAKLTNAQVVELRRFHGGKCTQKQVAAIFGISQARVSKIWLSSIRMQTPTGTLRTAA